MEPGVQTPETLARHFKLLLRRSLGCWLAAAAHLGLAGALRVRRYLMSAEGRCEILDGPSGAEVNFTDLHADRVYLLAPAGRPRPTSDCAGEGASRWPPRPTLRRAGVGLIDECECGFEHHMKVPGSGGARRSPAEEQWAEIEAWHSSRHDLEAHDMRL